MHGGETGKGVATNPNQYRQLCQPIPMVFKVSVVEKEAV